jgi:hypothetical protein
MFGISYVASSPTRNSCATTSSVSSNRISIACAGIPKEKSRRGWRSYPRLSEVDRKRSGYIDLAADGIISRDELEAKLVRLEETRETAEKELKALRTRQERLEELQRDKDALLDYYAALAPDALDSLAPEERHRLYRMLRLKIVARPDETIELTGDLVSAAEFSKLEITYPSCSSRTRRGRRSAGRTLWARGSPMRRSRRPCLPLSRTSRRRPP